MACQHCGCGNCTCDCNHSCERNECCNGDIVGILFCTVILSLVFFALAQSSQSGSRRENKPTPSAQMATHENSSKFFPENQEGFKSDLER